MNGSPQPHGGWKKRVVIAALAILFLGYAWPQIYAFFFESYTGVVNQPLTYDSSRRLTDAEFEALVRELNETYRSERALALMAREEDPFVRRVKANMLMGARSFTRDNHFAHIGYFRDAGIRQYEGPRTCLKCHETMAVPGPNGSPVRVNTLADVVGSVHFTFQRTAPGFSTYGYDGREVNAAGSRPIPVGKIDRACGVPGSFSWTGWAELVNARPGQGPRGEFTPVAGPGDSDAQVVAALREEGASPAPVAEAAEEEAGADVHAAHDPMAADVHAAHDPLMETRSEGCGQCHIGGGYHPATELMMPVGDVPQGVKQGIDCLICHARAYDMNYRYVIEDEHGRRWNQDRTLRTALTVGMPSRENCLLCHQHNMGGDLEEGLPAHSAPRNLGFAAPRMLHPGAKRANSVTAENDVHAAAGIICTDCHVPTGHRIPRGTKGVDLVANDIPGQEVACEMCHTAAPHITVENRAILNGHVDRLACETCHIRELSDDSVVLRDWIHPTWNEEEGVWIYTDIYRSGQPGKGFRFLWFNGNGTFLANALGDNPIGGDLYDPFANQIGRITHPEALAEIRVAVEALAARYPDIDVEEYIRAATDPATQLSPEMLAKRQRMLRENIRPLMRQGHSRIYPFKIFNAIMYEDMSNQGGFGAMILPFDYPSYYEGGDPLASMRIAIQNPIVRRMYQIPFKAYMMDSFMNYFGVERWSNIYPLTDDGQLRNVEAHWMRQMGTLMVNHGIQRDARVCQECHAINGIMDFPALGYPAERAHDLTHLPELAAREPL